MFEHMTNMMGEGTPTPVSDEWETLLPMADRVLIQPEEPAAKTKGGIFLPGSLRIPSLRGQVIALSWYILNIYDKFDVPEAARIKPNDRVIFHFGGAIPEDFEDSSKQRVLVPFANIIGKLKKG